MPFLLAALLVVGPLLIGGVLGYVLQRLRGRRVLFLVFVTGLSLLPLQIVWAVAPSIPHVSTWDLVSVCLLFGGGVIAAAAIPRDTPRGDLLLGLGATLASLLLFEIGARLFMPEPPSYPPAAEARLVFDERRVADDGPMHAQLTGQPWRCDGLYPNHSQGFMLQRGFPGRAAALRVLHVGDSMVHGVGIQKPFPAVLNERSERELHINAGLVSTGIDYHLLLVRRWLERQRVDVVVHYFYLGNDLIDLDQAYYCCGGRSLIDYSQATLPASCAEPEWGMSFLQLLAASPAPYPVRVATAFSHGARHLCRAFELARHASGVVDFQISFRATPTPTGLAHLKQLFGRMKTELAEQDVDYLVVLLPSARDFAAEGRDFDRVTEDHRFAREIITSLEIPHLDAGPMLKRAIQRHGLRHLYLFDDIDDRPADVSAGAPSATDQGVIDDHFNPTGHRIFAEWIGRELQRLGLIGRAAQRRRSRSSRTPRTPPPGGS